MNPQVSAAMISGGVALAVALLGIAGAIAAQLVATRRAFENSAALFERQHARQEASRMRELEEQARREDAYRYAEQRRTTYARFLRLADECVQGLGTAGTYSEILRKEKERSEQGDREPLPESAVEHADAEIREGLQRAREASGQLRELLAEIQVLGAVDVRKAAEWLLESTGWPGSSAVREFPRARTAFLDAARRELGIPPPPQQATS